MQEQPPSSLLKLRGRSAWLSVIRAYLTCNSTLGAELGEAGIRMAEHEVLINLLQTPGMTQQELASHSFAAKSGMSMLIAQMEQAGLVERAGDGSDARIKRVSLTPAGHALAKTAEDIQRGIVNDMAQAMTDEEMAIIEAAMIRVTARLNARSLPMR